MKGGIVILVYLMAGGGWVGGGYLRGRPERVGSI